VHLTFSKGSCTGEVLEVAWKALTSESTPNARNLSLKVIEVSLPRQFSGAWRRLSEDSDDLSVLSQIVLLT
jgi:hypothetical protein